MPMVAIYRLPHGQYGYSGHVINLPQDVKSITRTLPRLCDAIEVITVRREGSDNQHSDFRVRRRIVQSALEWLVQNNIYYRDITIDQSRLQQLPQNGYLSGIRTLTIPGNTITESELGTTQRDTNPSHFSQTFIPIHNLNTTELQRVSSAIEGSIDQSSSDNNIIRWPEVCSTPVNEFTTEGYMSRAFPTLYPTGAADFNAPRQRTVTCGNYFKHLMLYKDQRFAQHPRFRYFALNTEMRWRALQSGCIYVKQIPKMVHLQSLTFKTWLVEKALHCQTRFKGLRLHYVAHVSIGFSKEHDWLLW